MNAQSMLIYMPITYNHIPYLSIERPGSNLDQVLLRDGRSCLETADLISLVYSMQIQVSSESHTH